MDGVQFFLVEYDVLRSLVDNIVLKDIGDAQLRYDPPKA
jgi:hypothetical protein